MASLEEIFREEREFEERQERIRALEDELTAPMLEPDAPLRDWRQYREIRPLLSSGPECGPGAMNLQECRLYKEMGEQNDVPYTLAEYAEILEARQQYKERED